jgi:serine/threonine protein kinase
VSKYKHYDERKAADNFRPIVDAIRYCHEMGIAHRDLKVKMFIDFSLRIFYLKQVLKIRLLKYLILDFPEDM